MPTGLWQTAKLNNGSTFAPLTAAPPQISTYPTASGSVPLTYTQASIVNEVGLGNGVWSGCQSYAVDFSGDGRAQLFGSNGYGKGLPGEGSTGEFYWKSVYANCSFTVAAEANNTVSQSIDQTVLDTYSTAIIPQNGQWQATSDVDSTTGINLTINPSYPVIEQSMAGVGARATYYQSPTFLTDILGISTAIPYPPHTSTMPTLIFGDFNGDGLEDVIEPDINPAAAANGTYWLRWNTGNGFGPRIPIQMPFGNGAIYNPDGTINTNQPALYFQIYVADVNHDGRADLVIFSNYSGSTPASTLTILLSNGDGTFSSWGNTGSGWGGIFTQQGSGTGTIGDFNGDGFTDLLWLQGDNSSNGYQSTTSPIPAALQVLMQVPQINDRIAAVTDEGSAWPRETVSYALQWSDKPEAVLPCAYPQRCLNRGMPVVRQVSSNDTWANAGITPTSHTVYYSYEDPVADMRGRGSLGFRKVRVWDPTRIAQTITEYDNRTETGTVYVGPGHPWRVTSVTAIPAAASQQTLPVLPIQASASGVPSYGPGVVSSNARVVQTLYNNQLVQTNSNATYVIQGCAANVPSPNLALPCTAGAAPAVTSSAWEQNVSIDASVMDPNDPTSDNIWGIAVPSAPAWQHTTTINTVDAYSNITAQTEQSSSPLGTQTLGAPAVGDLVQTFSTFNNFNSTSLWMIGQLASRTVTVTEADPQTNTPTPVAEVPVTRQVAYGYDPKTGLLMSQTQLRQDTPQTAAPITLSTTVIGTTTLTRDSYGNVTAAATSGIGPDGVSLQTRQVNFEYDPLWSSSQPNERIFVSQTWVPYTPATGAMSWTPSSWTLVHPAYGVTVASMDANGVQAQATYDDQGRVVQVTPPVGEVTTISYQGRTEASGGMNGMILTSLMGGQTTQTATDAGGRTLQSTHLGFDGTVTTDSYMQYDLLGRAISATRPYVGGLFAGGASAPWTTQPVATTTYDGLNRMIQSVGPDGATTTKAYNFFGAANAAFPKNNRANDAYYWDGFALQVNSTTTTDPNGNVSRISMDVDGHLMASANLMSARGAGNVFDETQYHYAPFGLPDQVTLPSGNNETSTYDSLGRITSHFSPDGGTATSLVYDGFGELLSSTHQESGATTNHSYDMLGRSTGWSTRDPSTTPVTSTFANLVYDTRAYGLGKLATTTSSDGVTTLNSYDQYGRSTSTAETVGGKIYTIGASYDPSGRLSQVTYPTLDPSIGTNPSAGMTLQYNYNAYEYLSSLSNETASATGTKPYTGSAAPNLTIANLLLIAKRNPDGGLAQSYLGSTGNALGIMNVGYVPTTGQLEEQTFTTGSAQTRMDLIYAYYPNGLVQTRTDTVNHRLESFEYDGMNRLTEWDLGSCTGTAVAPTCAPATPVTPWRGYAYDVDGNLLGVSSASTSTPVTWAPLQSNTYGPAGGSGGFSSRGGPHSLNQQVSGGITTTYNYDAQGRQTTTSGGRTLAYNGFDLPKTVKQGSSTWTLLYDAFGRRVSKVGPDGTTITIGGLYEHRTSPAEDVFMVPGVAQVETTATGTTTQYILSDALGSTGVVLDGATGNVVSHFFYEPFGARITAAGAPFTGNVGQVTEGFTGQVHDDDFGLINFKGRMYDANLKRFLSVDPHVTAPGFGQSWNPYSYVYNSPLNFVDPSGFDGNCSSTAITSGESNTGPSGLCSGSSGSSGGGPATAGQSHNVNLSGTGPDGSNAKYGMGTGGAMGSTGSMTPSTPVASGATDNGASGTPIQPPSFTNDGSIGPTVQNSANYEIKSQPEDVGVKNFAPNYWQHENNEKIDRLNWSERYSWTVLRQSVIQLLFMGTPAPTPPCAGCILLYGGTKEAAQTVAAAGALEQELAALEAEKLAQGTEAAAAVFQGGEGVLASIRKEMLASGKIAGPELFGITRNALARSSLTAAEKAAIARESFADIQAVDPFWGADEGIVRNGNLFIGRNSSNVGFAIDGSGRVYQTFQLTSEAAWVGGPFSGTINFDSPVWILRQ